MAHTACVLGLNLKYIFCLGLGIVDLVADKWDGIALKTIKKKRCACLKGCGNSFCGAESAEIGLR